MARHGKGRGRLSSIDLLPPDAAPHVQWAMDELLGNQRLQADILEEFNERLAGVGCGPISSSAFNRQSLRLAATTRRMKDTQEITRAITERLGPDSGDSMTVGLAMLLKQAAWDIGEGGNLDSDTLLNLSRSLQAVVGAQKTSGDLRRKAQEDLDRKLKTAAKAMEQIGKERGLSQDTIEAVSAGILGIAR